jgi:DtxR family transcriptional regulator, Mn-dependent transcriptional regulator
MVAERTELLSIAEENYLKAIYSLQEGADSAVSTNALAERVESKASSVTDMVQKLSEKQLVDYVKYRGVQLTEKGTEIALRIIRKHRLWEVFLVDKLNFGWDEVHEIAEQLEHIQSVQLTDRLEEFLGFPKFDPHGDPIPDKSGRLARRKTVVPLAELEPGQQAKVVGVNDSSTAFLQYLDRLTIRLGDVVEFCERFEFDQSVQVIHQGNQLNLSSTVSLSIVVEPFDK